MPDNSPRLDLPFLAPAQAQKHVTINEALRRLDSLVMLTVESRSVTAEPASPQAGQGWLLPGTRTGPVWQTLRSGDFVVFEDGAWRAFAPQAGFTVFIRDESLLVVFDGSAWRTLSGPTLDLQNLTRLGIGTGADAANPFSAKLNSALWTNRMRAEGGTGDLRYVLNKEAPENVLSLLLQTGFSGRAEIGLVGDDDLTLRSSADGTNFREALRLRRSDGALVAGQLHITALNGGPLAGFRNRLINGDFRVNQRGVIPAGARPVNEYAFDRWRTGVANSQYSVSASDPPVVTLTAGALVQVIEPAFFRLAGQMATVSVGGASTVPIAVTIAAANGGTGSVTATIPAGSGRRGAIVLIPATMTGGASVTLSGANASFTEASLVPGQVIESFYEFRPAAVELSLCQRYYCSVSYAEGEAWFGNLVYWSIEFPATMRAIPTLGLGGAAPRNITVLTVGTRQVASLTSGGAVTDSRARVATVLTDTGLVNGTLCFLDGGFPFTFSAEL